jgi:hypothetical protein
VYITAKKELIECLEVVISELEPMLFDLQELGDTYIDEHELNLEDRCD